MVFVTYVTHTVIKASVQTCETRTRYGDLLSLDFIEKIDGVPKI